MRTFISAVVMAMSLVTFSAQAMTEAEFQTALTAFMAAANETSDDSIEQAEQQLSQIQSTGPAQALSQVFLGSLEAMKATTVFFPWNKMKHVEQGSEMMEEALDLIDESHKNTLLGDTPISLRMKLTVAYTYYRFPRFLNRYQDAKDLVADILASPLLAQASPDYRASFYRLAANIAGEDKDLEKQALYQQIAQNP